MIPICNQVETIVCYTECVRDEKSLECEKFLETVRK